MVANMGGVPSADSISPFVLRKLLPSKVCAALAPRQTMLGLKEAISKQSQRRLAVISCAFRLAWMRRFPPWLPFEVLDNIGHVSFASVDPRQLQSMI